MKEFTERHESMADSSAQRVNKRTGKVLAGIGERPYEAGPKTPHPDKMKAYKDLKASGLLYKEGEDAALKAGVSPGLLSRQWVRDVLNMEREIRRK